MGQNPLWGFIWVQRTIVPVNLPAVNRRAETFPNKRTVKKAWQAAWLLRATTCIDLTTLSGDDTFSNLQRLCYKAQHPIRDDLIEAFDMKNAGEILLCKFSVSEYSV
uniref:deoxyribose-phosphate aldolase-like n=1 Tax=Styela clava TaxID=7725 RepID=UPI00193A3446|nr:deoxyribose-phosphate aldolase-like [Styela clava]